MAKDYTEGMLSFFSENWESGEDIGNRLKAFATKQGIPTSEAFWLLFSHSGFCLSENGEVEDAGLEAYIEGFMQ